MRAKLRFDAYGLSLLLLALACGGGGSANNPDASGGTSAGGANSSGGSGTGASGGATESEGSRFIADYAAEVCAMYQPCCERDGLGFEASGCATWFRKVTAAYFKGEYDEARGAACLSAIKEARAADANRCTTVPLFDEATLREACAEAFTSSAREGEPLGGKCLLAADCASSAGENVICSSGSCLLERRGKGGDGPCYVSGMRVNETARCNAKDGLYCDRSANVCAPRVGPGDSARIRARATTRRFAWEAYANGFQTLASRASTACQARVAIAAPERCAIAPRSPAGPGSKQARRVARRANARTASATTACA